MICRVDDSPDRDLGTTSVNPWIVLQVGLLHRLANGAVRRFHDNAFFGEFRLDSKAD